MNSIARPDPAVDLIGFMRWLGDRVEALEKADLSRRINATQAARELGFDERYFHGRPWRVTSFGLNGMLHPLSVWKEWTDRPEVDRRAEWDAMTAVERRHARGVA